MSVCNALNAIVHSGLCNNALNGIVQHACICMHVLIPEMHVLYVVQKHNGKWEVEQVVRRKALENMADLEDMIRQLVEEKRQVDIVCILCLMIYFHSDTASSACHSQSDRTAVKPAKRENRTG